MFTRDELIAGLSIFSPAELSTLEIIEYTQNDFVRPDAEESIFIVRGSRDDYSSSMKFWLNALLYSNDWKVDDPDFVTYGDSGLCTPITKDEFSNFVREYSSALTRALPAYLLQLDEYIAGLKMYSDWNDVGAIIELRTSYIAFFWTTSA